jgi:hypothetical protein
MVHRAYFATSLTVGRCGPRVTKSIHRKRTLYLEWCKTSQICFCPDSIRRRVLIFVVTVGPPHGLPSVGKSPT